MDLHSFLSSLDLAADWVGLRSVKEHMTVRCARNGNFDPLTISQDEGIMVEVMLAGQFAYAATNDLSPKGVQQAANRALAQAKAFQKHQLFSFESAVRPPSRGTFKSPVHILLPFAEANIFNELVLELSHDLKINEKIINTLAMLVSIEQDVGFVSSNGADFRQTFHQRGIHLLATAENNSIIQSRSNGFFVGQGGDELFEAALLKSQAKQIANEAIELTQAEDCPEGEYDVILMPDQLYLQIHESIGHPLELDRILGDERNYAGWSFVQPEDFGHLQYGSELLNVTFDPTVPGEMASYDFDDTGAPATRQYLIQEGLLKRGLGGLESQARSKLAGASSTRATSWNRAPIDRMANINLEPGANTLEDMISSTDRGILMKTNRSWSIDDNRRKFQFGCEYGQLIEKGKLTKTLKNPNYRGTTTPFWHKLKMVGDLSTHEIWGSFYCGKGEPNQVIRVGHATPACLFSNLEVFGGGA